MDFSYWHLLAAWQQVRTRSNAAGIDGLTCELFAQAAEEQLHLLFRDLMHSRYFPKPATESVEVLFGYEGQGSHVYFQAFGSLLSEPFVFEKSLGG